MMNNPKSVNLNKWLFNPFIYIAGEQALFIGWAAMLAAEILSKTLIYYMFQFL